MKTSISISGIAVSCVRLVCARGLRARWWVGRRGRVWTRRGLLSGLVADRGDRVGCCGLVPGLVRVHLLFVRHVPLHRLPPRRVVSAET